MKSIYKITTKYTSSNGTNHNCKKYTITAINMKDAIRKTESYLQKQNSGAERIDSVEFVAELSF